MTTGVPQTAVVAVDVGGTAMKAAVHSSDGRVLLREDRPTRSAAGPDQVIDDLRRLLHDLVERAGVPVVGAGVGIPGLVDEVAGVARLSINIGWRDQPLRDILGTDLGLPVAIGHDVRLGGLAEATFGRSKGLANSVFVPIGTGIGAAMTIDDRRYSGHRGLAGEIGHLPVQAGGEQCPCGRRGCLERYASASAIARRYREAGGAAEATAAWIAGRIDHDPLAGRIWQEAVEAIATGLVACILTLDPELIVIGGGLSLAGDRLLVPLRAAVSEQLTVRPTPPVEVSALGIEAGNIGAALIAWRAASARALDWAPVG